MLLILCSVLMAAMWGWFKATSDDMKHVRPVVAIVAGGSAGMIAVFAALIISDISPPRYVFNEESRVELTSFGNISGIEGNFFLASGSIASQNSYAFFYKTKGGKKFGKLDADQVVIYEEKRGDGYISRMEPSADNNSSFYRKWWWAVPAFMYNRQREKKGYWAAHVPEGTVLKEFKVDLQNFNR